MKKNAYAKINLTLEIIEKRKDGYHNIKSIFQMISLHDTIEIEKSDKSDIIFKPPIPIDYTTIHKALNCFEKEIKTRTNVKITVKKNIPEKSGLGGGSSDAAITLMLLNELYKKPLTLEDLYTLGNKIGTDVPFFISKDTTALVTGIGERIEPIYAPFKNYFVIIALPNFKFSTEKAYKLFDKFGISREKNKTEKFIDNLNQGQQKNINDFLYNDFEIMYKHIDKRFAYFINNIKHLTGKEFHLTGSGSALYYIVKDEETAEKTVSNLKNNKIKTIVSQLR